MRFIKSSSFLLGAAIAFAAYGALIYDTKLFIAGIFTGIAARIIIDFNFPK